MIIMSVDYGDVRTGIAVCDRLETFAHPVTVISQGYTPKLIDSINCLIVEHKPDLIIVGLPKNMDSSLGERAIKCQEFAVKLSEKCGIEYAMKDERLTTVSAHKALNETNTRGKNRKNVVDVVAAVMILQDFIDSRKK